jgi:two-component system CheB/CheR fusion protein
MAATGSDDLSDYRRYVLRHPEEVHHLRSSLLIKVTDFFRDPELFTAIRESVIPALIEAGRERRELRLWSAGCATGEEAYSLAILVAQALGAERSSWSVRIFATDADPDAIAFARRGVYPASALRSLDPALLARHFRRVDGEYEVAPEIRAMTVFGEHDLAQRAPFPRIDMILCRNVLIYFTVELQRRALQLFAFSLRDGGFLILGKSESGNPQPSSFVIEDPRLRIFRRAGARTLMPAGRLREVPSVGSRSRRRLSVLEAPDAIGQARRLPTWTERSDSVLLRLPFGVCVVDATYDTRFLNTAARALLGIHGAAIGEDFIHQARALSSDRLRGAIDRALRGEAGRATFEVISETPIGTPRALDLGFGPLSFAGESGSDLVLVTVLDVSEEQEAARARDAELERGSAELARLQAQVDRLGETNAELLHGNEELATANAELRTANEELLVYNEELQAASEEAETLNEERQATNEELETLNEELQATVEELNTANEDRAARTAPDAGAGAKANVQEGPRLSIVSGEAGEEPDRRG